ncbi:beta-1,4-galactosyltransferase 4-like [Dreissena polymorpha]|uniref:Beta-1,4-galactosyltransferase n=1 Tax=Dreissena polymorpha TaxID=45954 RepID=A0A9D4RHX3_DREPO|nr:beta-1,4-galactosyltransferase 4-like [Dreissena polymorpha]KAH3868168.1 hypothetical protein DPMN_031308 [Dreissena polymorpha]
MRKFLLLVLAGAIVIGLYTYVTPKLFQHETKPSLKDIRLATSTNGNPHPNNLSSVEQTILNVISNKCKRELLLKGELFNISKPDILTDLPLNVLNTHDFLPVKKGGFYEPENCEPLTRTVIIIPYRNREQHLKIIINNLHRILQRQQLKYGIFVIELSLPTTFNIGVLMNMGFLLANNISEYDCFVFHDVDLIPLDDRIAYHCDVSPKHMSAFNTKYAKVNIAKALPYSTYVGGVISLRGVDYKKLNGFSNAYFGWGGTDDDIEIRAKAAMIPFKRENQNIGRYYALPHQRDSNNTENLLKGSLFKSARKRYLNEGLNTVEKCCKRLSIVYKDLYVHVTVSCDENIVMNQLLNL